MIKFKKTSIRRNKTALVLLVCTLCVMVSGFGILSGITMDGAALTHSGFLGLVTTQSAWFTPAWVVTPGAGYGLVPGKRVNKTYVRIIEGGYDSGKVWSALATDPNSWDMISISTSKVNDPFYTMYTYYGWQYFN